MYLPNLREKLSQGDIFTQIDLLDSATAETTPQRYNIIVLSHDCEIDKPDNFVVLVCAVKPLSIVPSGDIGNLKRGKTRNAMYVAPVGVLPESFIDFRYMFRVNKTTLEESCIRGLRIASLDDEARQGLLAYFYRYLARAIPTPQENIVTRAIHACRVTLNDILSRFFKYRR